MLFKQNVGMMTSKLTDFEMYRIEDSRVRCPHRTNSFMLYALSFKIRGENEI